MFVYSPGRAHAPRGRPRMNGDEKAPHPFDLFSQERSELETPEEGPVQPSPCCFGTSESRLRRISLGRVLPFARCLLSVRCRGRCGAITGGTPFFFPPRKKGVPPGHLSDLSFYLKPHV